jgi:hypothetical protein
LGGFWRNFNNIKIGDVALYVVREQNRKVFDTNLLHTLEQEQVEMFKTVCFDA